MNWKNAIDVASRWERIFEDNATAPELSGTSSSSSSSEDDDVKAMKTESKIKKKKKRKEKEEGAIAAIADQVHENQRRITKLETAQERMTAAQEGTNQAIQEILTKLDFLLAESDYTEQNRVPHIQNREDVGQNHVASLQQQRL